MPSSATEELWKAARRAKAYLSVGVNELDGDTIYNAQLLFGPDGQVMAGPSIGEEGILTAEVDARVARAQRYMFDPVGHYSRPDVFQLIVNDTRKRSVTSE